MTYKETQKGIEILNWGLIPFKEAWEKQEQIFAQLVEQKLQNRRNEEDTPTNNYLIFCEHPPVYTLGKSGSMDNLLLTENELKHKNIEFFKINRGGDITHHGPGQLVVYPIFDLENFFTDIHLYLRTLEEAVIKLLKDLRIESGRYPGFTGVWIDPEKETARKICAMGVKCSRWVTMHGIALNVNNDLSYFKNIIPCGIDDKDVSSIRQETGINQDMNQIITLLKNVILNEFSAYEIKN
ncbi:MAG: lipoyl(octanoyl) transferase LipB [Bacteroidia bacterium]